MPSSCSPSSQLQKPAVSAKPHYAWDGDSFWGLGVVLVPVLGGLVVVWLVRAFAPEAKGHGEPLYVREGGGIQLTPVGQALISDIRQLRAKLQDIENLLMRQKSLQGLVDNVLRDDKRRIITQEQT